MCAKPTIAAVNSWAPGGGMEFMLTTDILLMVDEAKIGLLEIKLGLFHASHTSPLNQHRPRRLSNSAA